MMRVFAALALPVSFMAHAQQYGDWNVNKELSGFQIANTRSGSNVTGIICGLTSGECTAYLGVEGLCATEGTKVPMLLNSSVAAFPITGSCMKIAETWVMSIDEFAATKTAMESGGEVGFAIPLKSGQFRVVRFSTSGGTLAIRAAMTKPALAPSQAKDQIL